MCGIVGVVGNTNATDILIQGLEKLEYRGYDSAGIFVLGGAENHLVKAVGRIAELSAKTADVEGDDWYRDILVGPLTENPQKITLTRIALRQDVLSWSTMG